ncbi:MULTISPECIES: extracellular solute-binding protein [Halanaerobium]|jgi:maltose-binding protein MalE|uniref:Carbohydrate ABC transporter substrate-binding protein (CUT1 family) n=1 Tax=Halanaerobium saccharolyticum TaxID=43595 RepID=A0A4R6SIU9_9FIRM|nr:MULTISPECIES: extracellular solute-binding protein [Halanaerobium]PUU93545.1 MAG: extracellular solute-binding protein [Halanaerobium sp.]TDQ03938.1 carbohydrate ABC transporter substrate-binding protein (CUT1 family) [Halanaerobium saccharolyticum]
MRKSIITVSIFVLALSLIFSVGAAAQQDLDKKEITEEVTLKLWEADEERIDTEILDPLIEKFENKYPNVTVERTHAGSVEDLRQNTQTAYMGGQGPDLVLSPFDHIGPFSIMGLAQPLDELMSQDMKDKYIKAALPGMSLHGKIYGVPVTMGNHLMLMYNKNIVDEAPKTWDELIEVAKKHTVDKDGDGLMDMYGLAYNLNEPFWWAAFHGGFGGWVFDEEYNPTLNTEATVDSLQFVHDLKFKHQIVPKEADYNLMDSLFKEGNVAFIINGDWSIEGYKNAENIDLGVAPIPKFEKTGKYGQPMTSGKGFIMMSGLAEQKQIAAIKFIDFMTSIAAQELYVNNNFLPSNDQAYGLPQIQNDPIMRGSAEQLRYGRAMPVVPEMRGIWDAVRPALQSVMSGSLAPEKAAEQMQQQAEQNIKSMQ